MPLSVAFALPLAEPVFDNDDGGASLPSLELRVLGRGLFFGGLQHL